MFHGQKLLDLKNNPFWYIQALSSTMLQTGRLLVQVPDNVDFFNPSNRTMALGSTQSLTEMSTRNLPGDYKAASA
jgi:hypothetical protein